MERGDVHELTAAYALDALEPAEEREFEEHLRSCESCRDELASFQATAAALGLAVAGPEPPRALRGRILERVQADGGVVVPFRRPRLAFRAVSAVAAVAAAVAIGLGIWAASLKRDLDETRDVVALLGDPAARSVSLNGAEGRLVVSPDGEAALIVRNLDAAPAGRTYEAWVIEGTTPRRAGLFKGGGARSLVRLDREVPAGAAVAVTIERDGGVDRPTARPIFTAKT